MNIIAPFLGILYVFLLIGVAVWVFKLANRLVEAQEQTARSIDRLSRSVELIAQSSHAPRLGGPPST